MSAKKNPPTFCEVALGAANNQEVSLICRTIAAHLRGYYHRPEILPEQVYAAFVEICTKLATHKRVRVIARSAVYYHPHEKP